MTARLDPLAFQTAVAKGLGRAVFAVREERPGEYDDLIVESCLHDQQESRYCDALRFPYQMRLIEAAGLEERVREAIFTALNGGAYGFDRDWILGTLGGYAQKGDEDAYQALQDYAGRGNDWAQQILAHTGDRGLGWLIDHVLPDLMPNDVGGVYQWHRSGESFRMTPARRRLKTILDEHEAREEATERVPTGPTLTPREYLDGLRAASLPPDARCDFWNQATDEECTELVEIWLEDFSPQAYQTLQHAVWYRSFPAPFDRLFEARDREGGKYRVDHLLKDMANPEVRDDALRRLTERPIEYWTLIAFRDSFKPGDEAAIRTVLPQIAQQDKTSRFGFTCGLVDLIEKHPRLDWQALAEWVYEDAGDSNLRCRPVKWMAKRGTLPAAIREEGVEDAEPAIRRICRRAKAAERG